MASDDAQLEEKTAGTLPSSCVDEKTAIQAIEIWFAKIERYVIDRGVLTSVADLSRKLMKYIRLYAKSGNVSRDVYGWQPAD